MKNTSILFLQGVLGVIALAAIAILIVFPLTEGRAANLDVVQIYLDPLILYGYAVSSAFFVALYQAFRLLGYIRLNKVFTREAVKPLKTIKYCAIILGIAILLAGLYIRLTHSEDDDPAGFLALCIVISFASVVVATAAAVFQKLLQHAVDMKTENDLTI